MGKMLTHHTSTFREATIEMGWGCKRAGLTTPLFPLQGSHYRDGVGL
jgi:hypothetical protein